MKNTWLVTTLVSLLSATSLTTHALTTPLPERLLSLNGHHTLQLADSLSRDYFYIRDAYTSALYHAPSRTGIQRLELTVQSERISGRGVGLSLYDTIAITSEWEQMATLEARLNALVKMMDTRLIQGDRIVIEYTPGRGSEVMVKNEYMGIIRGQDWFQALIQASMAPAVPAVLVDAPALQVQPPQTSNSISAVFL
ncbi:MULTISPECIES: chalcone isomerase family protein [unclassified Oceanobacter]|uniref:chalcone isomerase family protein n=1 Tax=unclassified Oceanobacter TaxID=2620260 RepID=UPI0026E38327|nr:MULTISPECIES: chalcone isomerase family protein [unclassified Oceanobacter]MDO6683521.1 chalcone isomerase family protein [Oceanobacter sp. 5_MG-2023]MDP2504756.1 chalcone isomerase family protein [Oceanobacter sp. 3_MG-2023]